MSDAEAMRRALETQHVCDTFVRNVRAVVEHALAIPGDMPPVFATLLSEMETALSKYDRESQAEFHTALVSIFDHVLGKADKP